MGDELRVAFKNIAPDDKEWTAYVNLLNTWTTPDRYLREIVGYVRSGPHYPKDMHVDLIKQLIAQERAKAAREALTDLHGWIDRLHYQPVNDSDRWCQASREIMSEIKKRQSGLQQESEDGNE